MSEADEIRNPGEGWLAILDALRQIKADAPGGTGGAENA